MQQVPRAVGDGDSGRGGNGNKKNFIKNEKKLH
jgi:hypothetical protein